MPYLYRTSIALAVCTSLAAPAHADGDPIIVTAGRTEQSIDRVGTSFSVVDGAEIESRQLLLAADILRTLPGLTLARNGGPGGVTTISIRGAESDQTVALIDGIKINDPASPGGGFDFANLASANIARIEVVRGAQSVLWGSQAIGGVINIITAEPVAAFQFTGKGEYGERDSASLSGQLAGKAGPLAGSVGVSWYRTDGISAFAGGSERDAYENLTANAKLRVEINDAVSIDLRGWYADSDTGIDGFPPPFFAFGDTRETSAATQLVGYAGINAKVGRLSNRIGFAATRIDRTNEDPDGFVVTTFDSRGTTERLEYQGTLAFDGAGAVFGAETEKSRYRATSFGGPVERADARINSVYGQASISPVDALTLTFGARHDNHDAFGGKTSLAANAVWLVGEALSLRASWGEGFKAPSLFQLYSDFGNRTLRPETAEAWDAGVTYRLASGRAEIGATYFRRTTDNLIAFVSCFGSSDPICIGRPFGTYDNVRRARASGVEVTLAASPTDTLSLSANYTHTVSRNRDSGLDLARRPRDTAAFNADWTTPLGAAVGATVSINGDRFDNAANTVRLDGFVLVDLRASIPLARGLSAYGRVENLFDADYQTVSTYGSAGRSVHAGIKVGW
jgi:vitamin B12 transporter